MNYKKFCCLGDKFNVISILMDVFGNSRFILNINVSRYG